MARSAPRGAWLRLRVRAHRRLARRRALRGDPDAAQRLVGARRRVRRRRSAAERVPAPQGRSPRRGPVERGPRAARPHPPHRHAHRERRLDGARARVRDHARARTRGEAQQGRRRPDRHLRPARERALPRERRRRGDAQEPPRGAAPGGERARRPRLPGAPGDARAVPPAGNLGMTPDELRESLAGGEVRPAYLVVGAEPLLRDDAVAALRRAALGDGPADFDEDRLDGERAGPAELVDAVRSLPVMAPRRFVILRDPEARSGRALGEALADLIGGLDASSRCVLAVVAEKADSRARWVKAFDPDAIVRCDAPRTQREVLAFVRQEARRQGVALDADAAELLAERLGPHLLLLRREIEKAALLATAGSGVGRAELADATPDVAEEPVWDLTDAIGEGRVGDALRVLARLLAGGAAPPVVLGALATHFRRLLRLRTGGAVQVPPFVLRKLDRQAQRYGPRRLAACLRAIHDTDLALKGAGALRPELALERLVMGLAG